MKTVYFGEFRLLVIEQIRDIEATTPESHSVEWFLLKYLRRIEKNANPPAEPGRVENSVRGLIRFYVDSIDEHSELGERCRLVYEQYRKALRNSREE